MFEYNCQLMIVMVPEWEQDEKLCKNECCDLCLSNYTKKVHMIKER